MPMFQYTYVADYNCINMMKLISTVAGELLITTV